MKPKSCAACRQPFHPRPQHPKQTYCTAPACQRERRRRWNSQKRSSDPDYRDNQRQAQQNWMRRHTSYWQAYRQQHPDYAARNRALQMGRNARMRGAVIAKSDASPPEFPLPSGLYQLRPYPSSIAKMDVWIAEIRPIS